MPTTLAPVVCKNEAQIGDAAFDGVRRRPVVAINDEGKLVVCCRRTASKNGWEVQGTLFQRKRKAEKTAKAKVERIKKDIDTAFEDLL